MLPYAFETVTVKVWEPAAIPEKIAGDEHAIANPPSSEQVVVTTVPVAVQAKVALFDVVLVPGALVMTTVGAVPDGGGDVTVHVDDAELLPKAFATVTLKLCDVAPSEL